MTTYTHKKKGIVDRIERKNITDYIKAGLFELKKKGYFFDFRQPLESNRLKELLNDPKNTTFKSISDMQTGFPFWHDQRVDFVRSNLGKGSIFYFICNGCRQRIKYLYEYSMIESPLCRTCCRLGYKYPSSRKARLLSRLLRKTYLTTEEMKMIIREAGITVQDVIDLEK